MKYKQHYMVNEKQLSWLMKTTSCKRNVHANTFVVLYHTKVI